jgi:hypothetical protein
MCVKTGILQAISRKGHIYGIAEAKGIVELHVLQCLFLLWKILDCLITLENPG